VKQETVSGSGISWAVCKSAPSSRQITMPAPHYSVFLQAGCPSCRPTNSVKAPKALKAFKRGIILLLLLRNTQVSLYSFLMNRSGHIGCTKWTTACYEVSRSSSPLVKYGLFRTISCLISLISSSYLICIVVYIFVSWLILCMLHMHPYRNVMHLYCKKRNWHYVVIRSCLAML